MADRADVHPPAGEARVLVVDQAAESEPASPQVTEPGGLTALSLRHVVFAIAAVAGVVGCWTLASMAATGEGPEELASVEWPGLASRRLGEQEAALVGCRRAQEGEPCHRHVTWALKQNLTDLRKRHPELPARATFDQVQAALHKDPFATCPRPCNVSAGRAATAAGEEPAQGLLGWTPSGRVVAQGQWCAAAVPTEGWSLQGCGQASGQQIKVLTYNLFWWHLFGRQGGNGGSAGHLIAAAAREQPFDVMAFQECEGVGWVLGDAGLVNQYEAITGPHALCIAYRNTAWELISDDAKNIAEDRADQWYGTRAGMWARLRHKVSGQVLFFLNHHGPLPLQSGGRCGGEATAFNLLRLIASEAQPGDVIVVVGDFNAGPQSVTLQSLRGRMNHVLTGTAFGGVDHVFSSCGQVAGTRNLGSGGSDHDALEAVIQL